MLAPAALHFSFAFVRRAYALVLAVLEEQVEILAVVATMNSLWVKNKLRAIGDVRWRESSILEFPPPACTR